MHQNNTTKEIPNGIWCLVPSSTRTAGWLLLACMLVILSCKDEDTKVPDMVRDSTSALGGTKDVQDNSRTIKDTPSASVAIKPGKSQSDSIKKAAMVTHEKEKVNSDKKPFGSKPAMASKDSAVSTNKAPETVAPPADKSNTETADVAFVPKYGIIPRNTTEKNINVFLNAFPDKTTAIRVNYDGEPDAEMKAVKTQILKVLKNTGYTSVSEKDFSLTPIRMPKDIHYELQRDGSVVIWVPIAPNGQ